MRLDGDFLRATRAITQGNRGLDLFDEAAIGDTALVLAVLAELLGPGGSAESLLDGPSGPAREAVDLALGACVESLYQVDQYLQVGRAAGEAIADSYRVFLADLAAALGMGGSGLSGPACPAGPAAAGGPTRLGRAAVDLAILAHRRRPRPLPAGPWARGLWGRQEH